MPVHAWQKMSAKIKSGAKGKSMQNGKFDSNDSPVRLFIVDIKYICCITQRRCS